MKVIYVICITYSLIYFNLTQIIKIHFFEFNTHDYIPPKNHQINYLAQYHKRREPIRRNLDNSPWSKLLIIIN